MYFPWFPIVSTIFFSKDEQAGLNWEDNVITVAEVNGDSYVAYPRMYALDNNTIICGYERDGDMYCKISDDNGLTWNDEILIAHVDGLICTNASFILLDSCALLYSYRANGEKDGKYYSSLRVSCSNNGGEKWLFHSVIAENTEESNNFNGLWEPCFGTFDGILTVFYSNDSLSDSVTSSKY